MTQIELPDWVVYLIGRQTIENEALRRTLAERNGRPPVDEPIATSGAADDQ